MKRGIAINEYNGVDFCKAHSVLSKHYDLGRSLTTEEVKEEIDNLIRKHSKMTLDDVGEYLYSELFY